MTKIHVNAPCQHPFVWELDSMKIRGEGIPGLRSHFVKKGVPS